MSVGALIEFYFKLIICITIPEEPEFKRRFKRTLTPSATKEFLSSEMAQAIQMAACEVQKGLF
ncbi:hypothetical protein [Microcystis aeruginosa]|uniref:hypothetical protein n=1 Tax=Microcystis aeruginosa TaxID=1126 RepID=UPI0011D11A3F|nr:hypothetical protein [Microcystis aeruginosa]